MTYQEDVVRTHDEQQHERWYELQKLGIIGEKALSPLQAKRHLKALTDDFTPTERAIIRHHLGLVSKKGSL